MPVGIHLFMYKIVKHFNYCDDNNQPVFGPKYIKSFDKLWKAKLYVWWDMLWWESVYKSSFRLEIEK